MLDISRTVVWGSPGQWRYSDGPEKPNIDWMCEAEPLYAEIRDSDLCKDLLRVAKGASHLCKSLLAMRERATDELIAEMRDALDAAIAKAEAL